MTQPRAGFLRGVSVGGLGRAAQAAAAGTIESAYTPSIFDKCETVAAPGGARKRLLLSSAARARMGWMSGRRRRSAHVRVLRPKCGTAVRGKPDDPSLQHDRQDTGMAARRWSAIRDHFGDTAGTLDNGEGSTLVVTKIGATDACHVAYVQAAGNAKATPGTRNRGWTSARLFPWARQATDLRCGRKTDRIDPHLAHRCCDGYWPV